MFKRPFGEHFDKFLQGDLGPLNGNSYVKKAHFSTTNMLHEI
jgi:hypothetical protein